MANKAQTKMVRNQNIALKPFFASRINHIKELEKRSEKTYHKLSKAAHTPELVKCLDPLSTDIKAHLSRIKMIEKLIPKAQTNLPKPLYKNLRSNTKSSYQKDIFIIEQVLSIQNQKLAMYELLHPLAKALQMEAIPELLEQTIQDNRNTNTWLRQIIQNIITPKIQEKL